MKTRYLLFLLLLTACKKDSQPIMIGETVRVKSNIFNRGVYQPRDTLYVDSIYFDTFTGLNYCKCPGPSTGILIAAPGHKPDSLFGTVAWKIPVQDLERR